MLKRFLVFLPVVLALACYQQPGAGRQPAADVLSFAQGAMGKLRMNEIASLEPSFGPPLTLPGARVEVERMAKLFPTGEPSGVRLIAFVENDTKEATDLAFAYEYPGTAVIARISIVRTGQRLEIYGLFIDRPDVSVPDITGVNWRGKRFFQYVVLGLAAVVPIVIVMTLVTCIRTPHLQRRGAWIVFVLFGVGQITLNWHTGSVSVNLLSILLLGAGYAVPMTFPPIVWPLLITVSLPVGAVSFLLKRRRDQKLTSSANIETTAD